MGNSLMAVRDIVINIKYIVVGGIIVLFLPEQASLSKTGLEKIDTYLTLSKIGCPVFKSAVIMPKENINQKLIDKLHTYFKTEQVTVRYQYFRPCHTPIQGGNRYELSLKAIYPLQTDNTLLWLLEPINRLRNDYGINLYFQHDECTIEIVGKGFDVSDLNRGQISPHQIIITELPIRKGLYDEWWKFLQTLLFQKKNIYVVKIEEFKNYLIRGITHHTIFLIWFINHYLLKCWKNYCIIFLRYMSICKKKITVFHVRLAMVNISFGIFKHRMEKRVYME